MCRVGSRILDPYLLYLCTDYSRVDHNIGQQRNSNPTGQEGFFDLLGLNLYHWPEHINWYQLRKIYLLEQQPSLYIDRLVQLKGSYGTVYITQNQLQKIRKSAIILPGKTEFRSSQLTDSEFSKKKNNCQRTAQINLAQISNQTLQFPYAQIEFVPHEINPYLSMIDRPQLYTYIWSWF